MIKIACNLFFVFAIMILVFAGCGDDGDDQASQPPDEVQQEIRQFSLVRMLNGKTKWKLKADTSTFLDSERVRLGKTELRIFGDKGDEKMIIRGDHGEVNERTHNIKITGNVVGTSSDGGQLLTEELYWRDRTGKIYTLPGVEVTITYEDSVIVGEELDADPELETAKLKDVTGTIRSEENVRVADQAFRKSLSKKGKGRGK